jgi:small-conductance mechanosensitive channel
MSFTFQRWSIVAVPTIALAAVAFAHIVYPGYLQWLDLNILPVLIVATIPAALAYRYTQFKIFAVYGDAFITVVVSGEEQQKHLQIDRICAALLALVVSALIYCALFVAGEQIFRRFPFEGTDPQFLSHAMLVGANVVTIIIFVVLYILVIRHTVKSELMRTIICFYMIAFLALSSESIIIFNGKYCDARLLKLVAYALTRWSNNIEGDFSIGREFCDTTYYWPEKVFEFTFYLLISIPIAQYFMDVLFYLAKYRNQSKNSENQKGAVEPRAVRIAGHSLIYVFCSTIALAMLRIDLGGFGLFSGLIGAGLSISFRDLLNNFFSGMLLNLDGSLSKKDVIRTADGVVGEVKEINLRFTLLQTKDSIDILIPNGLLIQTRIENLTRSKEEVRLSLKFSVSQEVDPKFVEKVALKACLYVPEVAGASIKNSSALFFLGCSENSNNFDLRFWVTKPEKGPDKLRSDVAYAIFEDFRRANISLPFYRINNINSDPPVSERQLAASRYQQWRQSRELAGWGKRRSNGQPK